MHESRYAKYQGLSVAKFRMKKAAYAYGGGGVADSRSDGVTPGENLIPKVKSSRKEAHSSGMKKGLGSYYGTGFKAPIGRMRDTSGPGYNPVTPRQLKKPPKSLV